MENHSQPDSRSRSGGDCSAAERLGPEQTIQETVLEAPATADVSHSAALRPFVWQSGRRLLLLEREEGLWVLAELEFEPEICRYTELRRAFYEWEREAVGALLSRTIRYGEDAAAESAELLEVWMRRRR